MYGKSGIRRVHPELLICLDSAPVGLASYSLLLQQVVAALFFLLASFLEPPALIFFF